MATATQKKKNKIAEYDSDDEEIKTKKNWEKTQIKAFDTSAFVVEDNGIFKIKSPDLFDPLNDPPNPEIGFEFSCGCFAQRGSGKTWLTTMIMYYMRPYFPFVYVFTETKNNSWYAQYLNPTCIFEGYNQATVKMLLDGQQVKMDRWREKPDINPLIMIIWDDCLPPDMQYDQQFKRIFFYGRHYGVFNWMNSQHFFSIPRGLRNNIDLVFIMNQEQHAQLEGMWMDLTGKRVSYREFAAWIETYTRGRLFLVFAKRDRTKPLFDRVYFGMAHDPGIFWMGSEEYWKRQEKHLALIEAGVIRERARRTLDAETLKIDTKLYNKSLRELEIKEKKTPMDMLQKAMQEVSEAADSADSLRLLPDTWYFCDEKDKDRKKKQCEAAKKKNNA